MTLTLNSWLNSTSSSSSSYSEYSAPVTENFSYLETFAAHLQYLLIDRTQLFEANDKMLAVQECYLSVCKEKDSLEEHMRNREKEEALIRDNEVCVCVCVWY